MKDHFHEPCVQRIYSDYISMQSPVFQKATRWVVITQCDIETLQWEVREPSQNPLFVEGPLGLSNCKKDLKKKKKSNFRSTLKYHQAIKLKGPALRSETNKAKFPNKVGIHLKKQCATTLNMKINYWKMMLREPRFNSARGSSARRAAGSRAMRQRDELILRPPTAADPPCWGQRRWTLRPAFKRWGK